MTAITYSPAARTPAATKAVAWTGLSWVTWRQHRVALAGVATMFGAIAAYLAIMGEKIHHAYAAYAACHPAGSAACGQLQRALDSYYGSQQGGVATSGINAQTVPFLLLAVPVLAGVFLGAPVLAREFESGTFRFAWTQGAGRLRWAVARIVPLAVAVTAAAQALSMLFSWYFSPFLAEGKTGKFPMQIFGNVGIDFAAWTLLAFAMAAFAGALIRRTVPAMAVALTSCTILDVVTMMSLRQHYQGAVASTGNPPSGSAWLLGQWFAGPGGKQTDPASMIAATSAGQQPGTSPAAFQAWLTQHHITQMWSYQPASRFWSFQLIETGWLVALSAALIAAAVIVVRRRAA